MPAVTDLTWSQLNIALKQLTGSSLNSIITVDAYGIPTNINILEAVGGISPDLAQPEATVGVIKFITRLYDACKIAQDMANQGKTTGEKLNAFGVATAAAPKGTLVPITRTIVSQADLSSATKIVGTNV